MSALNWTLFFGSRTRLVQSAIQIPPNSLSAALKLRQGLCLGEVASLCRGTIGDDLWRLDTLDLLCQNAKAKPLNPLISLEYIIQISLAIARSIQFTIIQVFTTPGHFNQFWEAIPHDFLTYPRMLGFDPRNSAPAGIDRSCWLQRWTAGSSAGRGSWSTECAACQMLRPWKREPVTKMDSLKYPLGPFFRKVENYHQPFFFLVQVCRLEHDVRKRTTHGEM